LPGGKVESGESDREALAREIDEELGMIIEVGARLAESEHRYVHGVIRLVAYRCRWISGEPRRTDHDRVAWIDGDEAASLAWAPADVPLLDTVFGVSGRAWLVGEPDRAAQP
jgi:8-oxo-dGTP diphosphatase